jgi:hypothetical protein
VEWAIGNLLEVYSDKMEDEDELNYWYIMNNLNDNAQCVNCKQFRRDRICSFYTRNDCHLCAYKMFNKTELELSHDFYEMNIIYCLRIFQSHFYFSPAKIRKHDQHLIRPFHNMSLRKFKTYKRTQN